MTVSSKLLLVRLAHTVIWAIFASMIMYILYAGIAGSVTTGVFVCIGAVIVESSVLVLCGWRCPLTILAYRYTEDRSSNFDIFLPAWLAEHNKSIFGILFLIGLLLVAYRVVSS